MRRRSLAAPLAKSLAFVLVTGLTTSLLGLSIANTGVGDTVSYKARFTDTTGLIEGDSVRIAGVKVGRVEKIEVVDHRLSQVTFSVRRSRPLPASSGASVKYLNMVGQRYVSLDRGTGPVDRRLDPGQTIPVARTHPALDLTLLFNGFKPLFEGLAPKEVNELAGSLIQVLQGEGGTVDSLLTHLGSLTGTVAAKDKVIGQVIANLDTVVETVNTREEGFDDLVTTLRKLVSGFNQDREPLGQAITALDGLTTSTAGLLEDGRAPLKKDIKELGRLSGNLDEGSTELTRFLQRTPEKLRTISRTASYGSWLNLYLCEARIDGVRTSDGSAPPTGIPVTEKRCGA